MSREIKFRVWDNEDYMSNGYTLRDIQNRALQWTDECVVMQFTGLKDRNGVDIYEGDIIETYQCEYVEVKFCNGAFVWYDGEPLGFGIHIGEHGENPFIISETTEDWCEIKGNIHQHPELLK